MLSPEDSRRVLRRVFRQRRMGDLALVSATLQTESRRSVFRRLCGLGYLRSCSHTGRYYTLEDIPDFDADGLWRYQGVLFSKHGTLKATTAHIVEVSEAGRTHRELATLLRVRVHNTLLDLVKSRRIGRELVRSLFVYVSGDAKRAATQIAAREQLPSAVVPRSVREAGQLLVVDVLLEVIHGAQLVPDAADVVARLTGRGVQATLEQVEGIFQAYGLKKTPGPRSRSSPR